MMRYCIGLVGVLLVFGGSGCSTKVAKPADGFGVTGHVEGADSGFVALYKVTPEEARIVDSVRPDGEGNFSFVGKVDQLQLFMLSFGGGSQAFFVAGNEDIEVSAKKRKAPETGFAVSAKAGEEQKKLEPVLALFDRQQKEFAPMRYEYELALMNRDESRTERYRQMLERGTDFYRQRYRKLADSLGPSFGAYTASTRLSLEEDFGYLDSLAAKLSAKYKGEPWSDNFARLMGEQRTLAKGRLAPDFALPSLTGGKPLGPSSFRGKILVLDFWASWCRPCRINSPEMVRLYSKFSGRGVQFLGVSLDEKKESWTAAVAKDGYRWPQVSDLMYWESQAAKLYKVQGIPALFLLDTEGRIIGKNLSVQQLEVELTRLTTSI